MMQPAANSRYNRMKALCRQGVAGCAMVLCLSCIEKAFYSQYQVMDLAWSKDKEYYFTYEIADNTVPYRLSLEIRNNNLYPYQNLWLFCLEEQPVGPVRRDTVECMLADDYGRWLGSGISIYHSTKVLRTHYLFPGIGQYTFSVRQGMRDMNLKGVEEIGLRIEIESEP
jgi:gliding motility-associated lipoprotein GldH